MSLVDSTIAAFVDVGTRATQVQVGTGARATAVLTWHARDTALMVAKSRRHPHVGSVA